jgi:DNA-binding IclR family transcriptional regulator
MVSQMDAFDSIRFPRARREDPISSQDAADVMERTGLAKSQAQRVLAGLRRYPNSTSMELAKVAGLDRHMVGRRLSELREANLVQRIDRNNDTVPCAVSEKRVCRWIPA